MLNLPLVNTNVYQSGILYFFIIWKFRFACELYFIDISLKNVAVVSVFLNNNISVTDN